MRCELGKDLFSKAHKSCGKESGKDVTHDLVELKIVAWPRFQIDLVVLLAQPDNR